MIQKIFLSLLFLLSSGIKSEPVIVIIQGISSSGKSSSAKVLQELYAKENVPFVLLQLDYILKNLPKKWIDLNASIYEHSNMFTTGLLFKKSIDSEGNWVVTVQIGDVAKKMLEKIIVLPNLFTADDGFHVIIEGAFFTQDVQKIIEQSSNATVVPVFLDVDLCRAEERERNRKGFIGLARGLQMRGDIYYDPAIHIARIDTTNISSEEVAQKIKIVVDHCIIKEAQ